MSHQASVQQNVLMQIDDIIGTRREKSAIPVRVGVDRNMKQNHAEAEKMEMNRSSKKAFKGGKILLAAGDRLGKKRQMHRWVFFLETTVLSLKCRSLCTKNTVVLASAPQRKQKRTEERHKLWGGEGTKNTKQGERI